MVQFRKPLTAILAAVAFAAASPVLAAEWTVSRSSGEVRVVHSGATPVSLNTNAQINGGDRIITGATGRVLLTRGEESIIISPGTELIVPNFNSGNGRTTLLQASGRVEFDVEKRNVQHFEVETPYLAAVVKGTRFVVEVGGQGAQVNVERGVVEVFDFDTGQFGLVKAGQRAATASATGAGLRFAGSGALDTVKTRSPRKSLLETVTPAQRDNAPGNAQRNAKADAAKTATATRQTQRAANLPDRAAPRAVAAVSRGLKITGPIGKRTINIKAVSNGLATSSHERTNSNHDGTTDIARGRSVNGDKNGKAAAGRLSNKTGGVHNRNRKESALNLRTGARTTGTRNDSLRVGARQAGASGGGMAVNTASNQSGSSDRGLPTNNSTRQTHQGEASDSHNGGGLLGLRLRIRLRR